MCTDVRWGKLKLGRSIRSFTSSREIEVNSIESKMATQATFLHVQSKSPFPNEIQCTCNKIPVEIRTLAVTLKGWRE